MSFTQPTPDCPICPRLAVFREANRIDYPHYYNAPVPSFGSLDASLLVVGLAPGLKGANQTGRPFTGDYAGIVLYAALKKYGFATGQYNPAAVQNANHGADGFKLTGCRITNSVRCVPPQNKPEPREIKNCNRFLTEEIKAMPNLKAILTLGQIAHKSVLMAFGLKQSAFAFGHGNVHALRIAPEHIQLYNSYHCSRYNINTGALTQAMFDKVVETLQKRIGKGVPCEA